MTIGTRLYTFFNGVAIGKDEFGNRYFEQKRKDEGATRKRRWVLYKGVAEPSKVPASWHGWLHHTLDIPPTEQAPVSYAWQKEHTPNLTGTKLAYQPPGHILQGGQRKKATGDYEAWKPE